MFSSVAVNSHRKHMYSRQRLPAGCYMCCTDPMASAAEGFICDSLVDLYARKLTCTWTAALSGLYVDFSAKFRQLCHCCTQRPFQCHMQELASSAVSYRVSCFIPTTQGCTTDNTGITIKLQEPQSHHI